MDKSLVSVSDEKRSQWLRVAERDSNVGFIT